MRTISRGLVAVIALGAAGSISCQDEPEVARGGEGGEDGGGGAATRGDAGEGGEDDGAPVGREVDEYYPVPAAAGVAPTPPMGWNSWNQFHCNVSADLVMEIADAMVDSGMREAGYEFVNIDDCWLDAVRASDGRLQPAADFFSGGGDLLVSRLVVRTCTGEGGAGGTAEPSDAGAPASGGGAGGAPSGAGTTAAGQAGGGGTAPTGGGADPGVPSEVDADGCLVTTYEASALDATNGEVTPEGWSLRPDARVTVNHYFPGGPAEITVTAAGSRGERAWPELRLRVGDAQVGESLADDEAPQRRSFSLHPAAGTRSIEVRAASGTDGLIPLAEHVHGLGLKLGIYADRGRETCGHRAGSGGHEEADALTFAAWGIDYLKYDNCAADEATIEEDYRRMGEALAEGTVYSLCAWQFYEWGVGLGHLWRTTSDIEASWESVIGNARENYPFAPYAGPNGWNDPDMLEVGVGGGMTHAEQQAHFALWAMMAAPLIAGNDLRRMSDATLALLTNPEVIAVDQDELGLQGVPVRFELDGLSPSHSIWYKPLNESGARAVLLLNATSTTAELGFELEEVGLGEGRATVRNLLAREDLEPIDDAFRTSVPGHDAVMLRVLGNEPAVPRGATHLGELTPIYAFSALGPVERDMSNGNSAAGDGAPIRLGGEEFTRGLGAAAPAKLLYRLGRACSRFTATAGVDDATNGRGSVVIRVLGDGEPLLESEVLTAASTPARIDVDVSGYHRLELRVTNALDGSAYDRVSFGDAVLECDD